MTTKQQLQMEREIRALLIRLKREIGDEYRASDDPDDNTPGMQVTFATKRMVNLGPIRPETTVTREGVTRTPIGA